MLLSKLTPVFVETKIFKLPKQSIHCTVRPKLLFLHLRNLSLFSFFPFICLSWLPDRVRRLHKFI